MEEMPSRRSADFLKKQKEFQSEDQPTFFDFEDTHMLPNNGTINGMGPIPKSDGVAFRVWAPHARKVALVGTFNAWNS
ncbi:MAG: hypothetical protein ACLP53_02935, partial [Isosphaeraceae bacterium]